MKKLFQIIILLIMHLTITANPGSDKFISQVNSHSPLSSTGIILSGLQDIIAKYSQEWLPFKSLNDHLGSVNSLAYSNDGNYLVTASSEYINLYDSNTKSKTYGERILRFAAHDKTINSVVFSPDVALAKSGRHDSKSFATCAGVNVPSIKIWNIDSSNKVSAQAFLLGHTSEITSIAYSPDGKKLLSGSSDCSAIIWDVDQLSKNYRNQIVRFENECEIISVDFSQIGKTIALALANNTIKLINIDAQSKAFGTFRILSGHPQIVKCLAYSSNGKYLASGSRDGAIIIWNTDTDSNSFGNIQKILKDRQWDITKVAFSNNGKYLASCGNDRTIRIWNVDDRSETYGNCMNVINCTERLPLSLVFSPNDNHLAVGFNDNTVQIYRNSMADLVGMEVDL